MKDLAHNIFRYATSELSQDAFICWLLSYAMDDEEAAHNPELKACADDMLRAFYPEYERPAFGSCVVTDIKRQYKKIDVLITVQDGVGECKFIIEDKVGAQEHDEQLVRYKKILGQEYLGRIQGVYYKSGLQGDLTAVDSAGYRVLMRKEILALLSPYAQRISNDIFQAYYNKLKFDHDNTERFREYPVGEWDWTQIEGFFNYLATEKGLGNDFDFDYVANIGGGFIGMFMKRPMQLSEHGVELYVQLDFAPPPGECRICLKAAVVGAKKMENPNAIADPFLDACVRARGRFEALSEKFGLKRPKRIQSATYMTIGLFSPVGMAEMKVLHYEQLAEKVMEAIRLFPEIFQDYASL